MDELLHWILHDLNWWVVAIITFNSTIIVIEFIDATFIVHYCSFVNLIIISLNHESSIMNSFILMVNQVNEVVDVEFNFDFMNQLID